MIAHNLRGILVLSLLCLMGAAQVVSRKKPATFRNRNQADTLHGALEDSRAGTNFTLAHGASHHLDEAGLIDQSSDRATSLMHDAASSFTPLADVSRRHTANTKSKATQQEVSRLLAQIGRELSPWKDGISLEMVERLYCIAQAQPTFRFQVVNGRPYVVGSNPAYETSLVSMLKQLLDLSTTYHLPDVDMMMSMADHCLDFNGTEPMTKHAGGTQCSRNAPLFSFSKTDQQNACVTVPDWTFDSWQEAFMSKWASTRQWMLFAAQTRPFEDRLQQIFWRGTMTNLQRGIVNSSFAFQSSALADTKLISYTEGRDKYARVGNNFTAYPEHCDYKYLLHLAGGNYSNRLKALLLCGSPVIFPSERVDESKESWWYHMLEDDENIIFTDLITTGNQGVHVMNLVKDLVSNEEKAKAVGLKGQHLAAEILHPENIERYWLELFAQYNKLQTFTPSVHADAVPLEVAVMRPERNIFSKERTCLVC